MAKLTKPVLCVDPSKEMLEVEEENLSDKLRFVFTFERFFTLKVAESKDGVESLCMSAEDWSAMEGKVDRVIIRGALHHFTR